MDTRENMNREQAFEAIQAVAQEINKVIVGQEWLIQRLLIGLFSEIPYSFKRDEEEKSGYGHVLLEGVPGLAKTLTVHDPCQHDQRQVSTHSVHAGPAPRRHHRHANF